MDDDRTLVVIFSFLILMTLPASFLAELLTFIAISMFLILALLLGVYGIQNYLLLKELRKTEVENQKEKIIREMYTDGLMTEHQLEEALDDVVVGGGQGSQNEERDLIPQRN
jgi:hypothetical protein